MGRIGDGQFGILIYFIAAAKYNIGPGKIRHGLKKPSDQTILF